MSASNFQIDKLDESNYDSWAIQMRSILIHSGQWNIVNGKLKQEDVKERADQWLHEDEKALASIFLCVKPTQLGYIRNCTTSHDAWKKLEETYVPRGPLQKVSLYKRLVNLKMAEGGSMVHYINEFSEVYEKLKETGIELQDELLVIMILSSLSSAYENFVVAIETRDDLPSLSTIKQKLLEEGKRREEGVVGWSAEQAFAARATTSKNEKKPNSNNKNKKNFKGKCYVCGVKGHFANKCEQRKTSAKTQAMTMVASTDCTPMRSDKWYIDSGATSHMSNQRSVFVNYHDHDEIISLAGNKHINAKGKGDVLMKLDDYDVFLENVLYSPELQANFISVSKAVDRGLNVNFGSTGAIVKRPDGDVVLRAKRNDNMFEVCEKNKEGLFAMNNNNSITWHNRYGHLNFSSLHELSQKSMVKGMQVERVTNVNCQTCMMSKIHTLPFPNESQTKSNDLLELVHSDVCGPFRTNSIGGSKYFVTFIDDKSRRVFVYFMRNKSEVLEKFKLFKAMVERQTDRKIKSLRTDNGREYVNADFDSFLQREGIQRQLTVPYTPQQNGVAERANRTIVEMTRSMMLHAGAQQRLWAEAVNTAVYIRNRCPTKQLKNETPYYVWCGREPSVKHFKTFGCIAVALDKSGGKSKFDAKGSECIMVGYSTTAKAYRLFDAKKNKVFEQRDVLFDENNFGKVDNNKHEEESNNDLFVCPFMADVETREGACAIDDDVDGEE